VFIQAGDTPRPEAVNVEGKEVIGREVETRSNPFPLCTVSAQRGVYQTSRTASLRSAVPGTPAGSFIFPFACHVSGGRMLSGVGRVSVKSCWNS
jgi:hypothetical protein